MPGKKYKKEIKRLKKAIKELQQNFNNIIKAEPHNIMTDWEIPKEHIDKLKEYSQKFINDYN